MLLATNSNLPTRQSRPTRASSLDRLLSFFILVLVQCFLFSCFFFVSLLSNFVVSSFLFLFWLSFLIILVVVGLLLLLSLVNVVIVVFVVGLVLLTLVWLSVLLFVVIFSVLIVLLFFVCCSWPNSNLAAWQSLFLRQTSAFFVSVLVTLFFCFFCFSCWQGLPHQDIIHPCFLLQDCCTRGSQAELLSTRLKHSWFML